VASAVGGADTVYLACGINTLYWRVFSTPDVKTIADLKGKKIGVTTIGSQEDSVIRFILKSAASIPIVTSLWLRSRRADAIGRLEQRCHPCLHFHSATRHRRREARSS